MLYWFAIVLSRRLVQLPLILRHDVVFFQCSLSRSNDPPVLELILFRCARLLGRKVVYHLDDALYTRVPARFISFRAREADLMITGNEKIAEFGRSCGARVEMLEGWIRAERYPIKARAHSNHTRPSTSGT